MLLDLIDFLHILATSYQIGCIM